MSPVLPYLTTGELQDLGGAGVHGSEKVPLSIWPAVSPRAGITGKVYDHEAEADTAYAVQLDVPNRQLVIGAKTYKIIHSASNTLVPHVALFLKELRPGG